jgi:integrase
VSTLATFAQTLHMDTVGKKVLKKLGYAKKETVAYSQQDLNLLWAAMIPDEELPYKFFLSSMGRDQEVATRDVRDLDFVNNTVHFSPNRERHFRLKSKRNRRGNVGDRYVPLHPDLMLKLREYIDRAGKKDDDLAFAALNGGVEQHFLRRLEGIVNRAGLKLSPKVELHRFRKSNPALQRRQGPTACHRFPAARPFQLAADRRIFGCESHGSGPGSYSCDGSCGSISCPRLTEAIVRLRM